MAVRLLETKTRFFDQDSYSMDKNTAQWGWMKTFLDLTLVDGTIPLDVVSITVREEPLYWLFDLITEETTGFKANLSVVEISNSTIPSLNKVHRVQEINTSAKSFTLAILKSDLAVRPSDIPDALGTKVKLSPLGYKKTFEEGLKVVYESANPENKRCYLRVDNGCPVGYLPYYTKFARVSMFSDINYIDDYTYRVGRVKAPAEVNYSSIEDNIRNIWTHSRMYTTKINDYPSSSVYKFFIIGDDKTFYIFIEDLYTSFYKSELYTFGEYTKVVYKEDPYPFILYSPLLPENYTRVETDNFFYDRYNGKHLFAQTEGLNFTPNKSDTCSYWENPPGVYGPPFKPYMNELPLQLSPKRLTTTREGTYVTEGNYKGLYSIGVSIPLGAAFKPKQYEVLSEIDFFMYVYDESSSTHFYSFCIDVKDWE